ncbi:hypothetical protein BDF21DRAFT_414032 [Thamnidium elegans]|nr:hypothetical protein BDF21DRAFT_414032 [Thamnidium elegans]
MNSEHKEYFINLLDEKTSIVLDEIMERLTSQFKDLDISRSNLYIFVTTKCNVSLKRAKIEARFQ